MLQASYLYEMAVSANTMCVVAPVLVELVLIPWITEGGFGKGKVVKLQCFYVFHTVTYVNCDT